MNPQKAIEKLSAAGMTETAIANAIGVSQATINRIRNGVAKTSYEIGTALVKLAEKKAKN